MRIYISLVLRSLTLKKNIGTTRNSTFALALLFCLQVGSVSAQDETPSPPVKDEKVSGEENVQSEVRAPGVTQDNLQWSLGAGVIASPRPYIGTSARVFPIPSLGLQYKRWFVQGIRGGYSFVKSDRFTANVFAQARFRGLEPEDSPFLTGMEERKKSLDAGVELIYSGRPIGFRASFLTDTLGRSNGQEVSLLAVSGIPLGRRGIILFGIGPRWMSQDRTDYYFGVRESEATPSRPAYTADAAWNLDINLTAIINLRSKWSLVTLINREGLGSSITDSPLVERSAAYALIVSLSYNF
jgi:outer membrane protein